MEVFDFASIMSVIRKHVNEDLCPNQVDLIYALFRDIAEDPKEYMDFDNGQICRWLSGLARLSPKITAYYRENSNRRKLSCRIEDEILPMIPDSAMAVQDLYDLLVQAPNVSEWKKKELTDGFSFEEEEDFATFMTELLCFGMELPFVKRDVRKKALPKPGSLSPVVTDYVFDADIPTPCNWFVGRENELMELHGLLVEKGKVFLHGIPGIGKSELAKVYGARHRKDYTNIIYIPYEGDLKQAVADLDFADDLSEEDDDKRFKRHNRFLRSLREDSLVIVDNFNAVPSQDPLLDVVMKYRCRVLFTTRSRFEYVPALELKELGTEYLLQMMEKLHPKSKDTDTKALIIELLHRHTFAVELAARLLAKGILSSKSLLTKLEKEKTAMDASDIIGTYKDGQSKRGTYYEHIHNLFSLYKLTAQEQDALRNLTMIPDKGISARTFARWLQHRNMNTLNSLMEMGFLQPKSEWEILIHPMIREVSVTELKPSVDSCETLLESLESISLLHGIEFANYRQMLFTLDNIIEVIEKDNIPRYLRFLGNVFQFMDKYRYRSGMESVIKEMEQYLSKEEHGKNADRALLLDCRATTEPDSKKKIELLQKAILTLGEINEENAHLGANLHGNLGALYHQCGNMTLAKEYMEKGAYLLERFGLLDFHDSVIQICNYEALLTDVGEGEKAYTGLSKLATKIKKANSDLSLDYGMVQQLMAHVCVAMGDFLQGDIHRQAALRAFEFVFEDEPELLAEKYGELGYASA